MGAYRIKKSVSGDLTMIRNLIPLSPNVLSAFRIFMVLLIIAKNTCRDRVSDCQELYCTHEEADTRIILHRTSPDDISRDDK
jgi:hypothetical protein